MAKQLFEIVDETMNKIVDENKEENTLTVRYTAMDGTIFRKFNVKWYEMSEAFSELSRRAYEHGTEVHHVIVY